jgi:uncharacterized protein YdeI (YjbR/CyaY-like superfamily)
VSSPDETLAPLPPGAVLMETRAQWRRWLQKHHTRDTGIWLTTWKKASGKPQLSYDDLVEEALAYGWVDSKTQALDAWRSMLWLAPRRPGSLWSGPNKQRVERLIAAGLMAPAGQAKVEAAQADGTWNALDAVEALEVPADLAAAFDTHPGSRAQWEAFPRSVKRGVLEWILQARKPDTRRKRVEETARLAARGERANQWKRPAA